MLVAFIASVSCLENENPLLWNISRLLESVVQSQSAFNATLTRLDQSAADLQRSHVSLNSSLTRVEQSLSTITCVDHGNRSHDTTSVAQPVSTTSSVITANCFTDCLDYRTRGHGSTSGIITTRSQDGECSQES